MKAKFGLMLLEMSVRTAEMCWWPVTVRQLSFFSAVRWPGSNRGHGKDEEEEQGEIANTKHSQLSTGHLDMRTHAHTLYTNMRQGAKKRNMIHFIKSYFFLGQ